jgi:predicted acetyltransferase
MSFHVRVPTAADQPAILRLIRHAFTADLAQTFDDDRPMVADERRLVAEADGRVVGHLGVWPLGHWLGGRRVATGGVSAVVIDPAWRGRGVGTRLLTDALAAMHERGEVLATLFPLTRAVYRRLGWEIAGERPEWRVATDALAALPAHDDVELVPGGEHDLDAMHELETRVAPASQGMLARPREFARRALDPGEGHAVYLARREGELVGYVIYAHASASAPDELFTLRVRELVAADGPAELALWRLLGSHVSGARTVSAVAPPAPSLELSLPERALQPAPAAWRWMTRVVDAPGAVAARGWSPDVEVSVDLTLRDEHLPANDGHWRLEIGGGAGRLHRGTRGGADLDVGGLAALLTGWASPATLAYAGRLRDADERTLAALTRATAGPVPWVRDFF